MSRSAQRILLLTASLLPSNSAARAGCRALPGEAFEIVCFLIGFHHSRWLDALTPLSPTLRVVGLAWLMLLVLPLPARPDHDRRVVRFGRSWVLTGHPFIHHCRQNL